MHVGPACLSIEEVRILHINIRESAAERGCMSGPTCFNIEEMRSMHILNNSSMENMVQAIGPDRKRDSITRRYQLRHWIVERDASQRGIF